MTSPQTHGYTRCARRDVMTFTFTVVLVGAVTAVVEAVTAPCSVDALYAVTTRKLDQLIAARWSRRRLA